MQHIARQARKKKLRRGRGETTTPDVEVSKREETKGEKLVNAEKKARKSVLPLTARRNAGLFEEFAIFHCKSFIAGIT